jgi:hypothetical protein
MSTQLETEEPRVTTLLSGIVQDMRQLFVQQMTLFQVEIKNDVRRVLTACIPIAAGAGACALAVIILAIGAAHLLSWIFPNLPLWGSFAIVGFSIALIGMILVFWGKSKLDSFNPLPDKSLDGLKENLQWKTKT